MSIFYSGTDTPMVVEKLNCRLSILGAGNVGKTKIVDRLLGNIYVDRYTPTVEEFHEINYEFSAVAITVEIVDTSGTNQFPDMRKLNIQKSDLILLVYDISDTKSFSEVRRLYRIAREFSQCIIIIVGAKADLLPTINTDLDLFALYGNNTVTSFLDSQNDKHLFHRLCSAKNGQNIELLLETGLVGLFPDIIQHYESCTTFWCRFLARYNISSKTHDPNSHYGFRCIYKQLKTFLKEKTHVENFFL